MTGIRFAFAAVLLVCAPMFALAQVYGPSSSVVGNGACWNNASGTLISDCGYNGQQFPTVSAVNSATIPAGVSFIRTLSNNGTTGDSYATWQLAASMPSQPAYIQSSGGTYWVLNDPVVNPLALGASANGSTSDQTATSNAMTSAAALGEPMVLYPGTWTLTSTTPLKWPSATDGRVRIDTGAEWTSGNTGHIDLTALSGDSTVSASGLDMEAKTFDTTWVTKNTFMFSRLATNDNANTNVLAVQGTGVANVTSGGAYGNVWGGEFTGIVNSGITGGNAAALEAQIVNNGGASATTTGIIVAGKGATYSAGNAILIGSGANGWQYGIVLQTSGTDYAVSQGILRAVGSNTATGIVFSGLFSTSQLDIPALLVGPNAAAGDNANRFELNGSSAGNPITLNAIGSDPNINILLRGKGGGSVLVQPTTDSTAAFKVENAAGVTDFEVNTSASLVSLPALTISGLSTAGLLVNNGSGVVSSVDSVSSASVPANFSAVKYLTVSIAGATYYIPADTATW